VQDQPTAPFGKVNTGILGPHLGNTPVPPVRSQPTENGSASGSAEQVATTSGIHTQQKVNLIAYFALASTLCIFKSLLVWHSEKWLNTLSLTLLPTANTQCDSNHDQNPLMVLALPDAAHPSTQLRQHLTS